MEAILEKREEALEEAEEAAKKSNEEVSAALELRLESYVKEAEEKVSMQGKELEALLTPNPNPNPNPNCRGKNSRHCLRLRRRAALRRWRLVSGSSGHVRWSFLKRIR